MCKAPPLKAPFAKIWRGKGVDGLYLRLEEAGRGWQQDGKRMGSIKNLFGFTWLLHTRNNLTKMRDAS